MANFENLAVALSCWTAKAQGATVAGTGAAGAAEFVGPQSGAGAVRMVLWPAFGT